MTIGERFGPDATFSAIANWLTENVSLIDDLFSARLDIAQVRLGERMSDQHRNIDAQWIAPKLQIDFTASSGSNYRSEHGPRTRKVLEPFERAWREKFATLKPVCVIREDIYYQETLELAVWRGGVVLGTVRYPGIEGSHRSRGPEYEVAEQYFTWTRRGNRYVGGQLEIRLWGLFLPNFIAEGGNALGEIRATPTKLLSSPEILPGRDTGYIALYQMQRPPTYVEFGGKNISAIYEGENETARNALTRLGE